MVGLQVRVDGIAAAVAGVVYDAAAVLDVCCDNCGAVVGLQEGLSKLG
jgi:hypothetical protein